ncbi:hypothetical protein C9374_002203 [Naegleria lovaniensis]|uniref:protein-tyrosine-phosphatase n=1 Tax=Naegleria lovaniensis TaxID=51637 RepID=A0AA88GUM1_NAELO|nr:uncharacterized protein C9374_002203 [Naegleria lovaniensis]KAG2386459.1 hypothetical protein C9374_002203 [Naegleria lovaniensis]
MPSIAVYEDVGHAGVEEVPSSSSSLNAQRSSLHQQDSKWFIHPTHYSLLDELEIYPRVYIGGQYEAKDPEWFAHHQISHVLNVSSLQNTFQKKTLYYHNAELNSTREETTSQAMADSENVNPNIIIMKDEIPKTVKSKEDTLKNSLQQPPLGKPMNVTYLKINVDDSTDVKIARHFDKAITFVRKALEENSQNRVLIHCKEGKSRSVTMMLAFGMTYFHLTLLEAFRHFENKTNNRSRINLGFQLQLMNYEKELLEEKGVENPKNSLDFLNSYQMSTCRKVPSTNVVNISTSSSIVVDGTSTAMASILKATTTTTLERPALKPISLANGSTPQAPSITISSTTSSSKNVKKPIVDLGAIIQTQEEPEYISPIKAVRKLNPSSLSTTMTTTTTPLRSTSSTPSIQKTHRGSTAVQKTPKNKLPPTPLAIASELQEGKNMGLIGDDYASLEFKFDDDDQQDVEISDALDERVFMTTPLKKRKSEETATTTTKKNEAIRQDQGAVTSSSTSAISISEIPQFDSFDFTF